MSTAQVENMPSPAASSGGDNNTESASAGDLLQCFNTSCGAQFREVDNGDDACTYHQGKPYFHDGYKEWTCCKMKSRDFTIFMGFKGCTKGRHSNVQPEKPKPEPATTDVPSPVSSESPKEEQEPERPFVPPDESLVQNIKVVESANLASAPPVKNIVICKNCKAEESSLVPLSQCFYHRGVQVFHDSLKFWSCCPHKKFTEFEEFQKLPPCAQADRHQLMVKIDYKENWFQTGPTLTIALYGLKGARYVEDKCQVKLVGGRKLFVRLVNAQGITIFEKQWHLFDYINLNDSCKVLLNPSNVQIVLQKANGRSHWPELVVKQQPGKP